MNDLGLAGKLADLRKLAEDVPTTGPWEFTGDVESIGLTIASDPYSQLHGGSKHWDAIGRYIAAANPTTILALLDELEKLRSGQRSTSLEE